MLDMLPSSLNPTVYTFRDPFLSGGGVKVWGIQVENCPYQFERQSYCHKAGDGRVPDRTGFRLRGYGPRLIGVFHRLISEAR